MHAVVRLVLLKSSVLSQDDGEEEIDAMLRITRMPADQIQATRDGLKTLRESLNQRSFVMLDELIDATCKEKRN